jgi:hypothetical protein
MPNLLINQVCNRNCPYCFASSEMSRKSASKELSFDGFSRVLDFMAASNQNTLNILGGEPTLHPEFALFLRYALGRGFVVRVFTNAMISKLVLDETIRVIEDIDPSPGGLRFVVNVNQPELRTATEERQQSRSFATLARWCNQSFNMYRPDHDMAFLIENVREHGIQPEIRIGLAQPMAGGGNEYLSLEDYPRAMRGFMAFAQACDQENIALAMDCGFPLCRFSDADLGKLYKARASLRFSCGPCVDIDPELMVRYCYPMTSAGQVSLLDYGNLEELANALRELAGSAAPQSGIYLECAECLYHKRGQCAGGCMAHYYDRLIEKAPSCKT